MWMPLPLRQVMWSKRVSVPERKPKIIWRDPNSPSASGANFAGNVPTQQASPIGVSEEVKNLAEKLCTSDDRSIVNWAYQNLLVFIDSRKPVFTKEEKNYVMGRMISVLNTDPEFWRQHYAMEIIKILRSR